MKTVGVSRAVASLGLILGSRDVPLWENEGPIDARKSPDLSPRSPRSSDRPASGVGGGKVDVRIAEISGLEKAAGLFAPRATEASRYVLEVKVGTQVQETDDLAYFPPTERQPAYNKAFRYLVEADAPPELSVTIYRKQRDGCRGRQLAVGRILLNEAFQLGFHNVTLTLVSRRGLPNARLRLGMVFWRPGSAAPAAAALHSDGGIILRKSRSSGSRHIVLAGSQEAIELAVAVPDP